MTDHLVRAGTLHMTSPTHECWQEQNEEPLGLASGSDFGDPDEIEELAASIVEEFKEASRLSSLESAIYLLRKCLVLQPAEHPLHSSALENLALVLVVKFSWTGNIADVDEAVNLMESKVKGTMLEQQSTGVQPENQFAERGGSQVCQYNTTALHDRDQCRPRMHSTTRVAAVLQAGTKPSR